MTLPDTQTLKVVIVDILSRARDQGRLSQLTVRLVRQELATHFDIKEDVLNSGKYKPFIKDTVLATVESLQNAEDAVESDGDDEVPPPKPAKKEKKAKADGVAKPGARKRQSKVQVQSSGEEPQEVANTSKSGASAPKKASAPSKPPKPVKPSKAPKKPESELKYKSKAIIESSGEESEAPKAAHSPKKERKSPKSSHSEQKQGKVKKGDSDVEMGVPGPSGSSSKPKHVSDSPKAPVSKAKKPVEDPMESELSSVIDEPPKKRQKKQEKESVKPPKGEKAAKRGKKDVLSKDEETVNKLKSMVVACGVRKVWKKEFEGLDKPSQQIKRLHSILNDLGMTPRYSLEKAKAIRDRRELAQELKDVQEFEKKTVRRGKGVQRSSETAQSSDQGGSDADVPVRQKQNARARITAFLQDQSEEE